MKAAPPHGSVAGSGTSLRLPVPGQQIIYTASLTVRARNVSAAADTAASYVTDAGGYVSNEQQTADQGGGQGTTISAEFKIPAAQYLVVLPELRKNLGTELAFSEQAQDVTQQVADVNSRVASTQAAIAQLRTLLSRAGSISDLLSVQQEINSQQADLEALLAQQEALAHETTYATVTLTLVSKKPPVVRHHPTSGGFLGGLKSGWHGLVTAVSWLLTALGTLLPFLIPLGLLTWLGFWARRRLLRRRTPPAEVS